ncbi:uncharacterized protein [Eurosta solidaginis]|uniref:uncharacterized protein n=1 Tax=Eurosta solidaginis TaxID=178769 RepID=UPI0035309EFA
MVKHQIASSPLLVLIFLTSSYLVAGQGRKPGSCRTDIQYVQNVEREAFEGIWYMHRGMTLDDARAFRCRRMNFTYFYTRPHETAYRAEEFKIRTEGQTRIASIGSLKFPSNCAGQFRITYWPRANPGTGAIDWNNLRYKVLTLDSQKLIIYACQNFPSGSEHAELVWVYTRQPDVLFPIEIACMAALRTQGINVRELYRIYHVECEGYEIPRAAAPLLVIHI